MNLTTIEYIYMAATTAIVSFSLYFGLKEKTLSNGLAGFVTPRPSLP